MLPTSHGGRAWAAVLFLGVTMYVYLFFSLVSSEATSVFCKMTRRSCARERAVIRREERERQRDEQRLQRDTRTRIYKKLLNN